ncbi:uncharacterized protein LOC126888892 [Diabrotica virgifera virgifera]|uniref:Protein sleepless n=1 Tax=Diabrotica virgifera virgifera TaxID=50390 RepID=A0ABM5KSX3_DIAVI|nr:uncharacterized protein LOC126888892 [Diabrotica virgifera virgifera]
MASTLTTIVAVLLVINGAYALECYKCNSQDKTLCKWGLTSFLQDTEQCSSVLGAVFSPKCYKITAKSKGGSEYIARGCMATGLGGGCSAMAKTLSWFSSAVSSDDPDSLQVLGCETCETDKCNSATKLTGFAFIGLVLSAMAFLM